MSRLRLPRTNRTVFTLLAVLCLSLVLRAYAAANMGIADGNEYGSAGSARSLAESGEFTGWSLRSYFYATLLAVFGKGFLFFLGELSTLSMIPIYSIHGYWIFINRVFNVLLGIICIFLTFRLGKACYGTDAGLLAAFLQGINCLDVFWGMRSVPDPSSTVFLVASALFLVKARGNGTRSFLLSGCLMGLSVMCRYSSALYAVPMIALILFKRDFRKGLLYFVAGGAFMMLIQGTLDLVTWGRFFGSLIDFFSFNILRVENPAFASSATYPMPFKYYYVMLPVLFGHAYILPVLALERRDWRSYFLALEIAFFLYVMSSVSHKEIRFILTLVPFVCVLSAGAVFSKERSRIEKALIFLLVVLTVVWQFKRLTFFFLEDPSKIFV